VRRRGRTRYRPAGDGDDLFHADGEADTSINGGPGTGDTAFSDGALDPNPVGSRSRIPARRGASGVQS
jgi:hypothetical protein